VLYSFQHVGVRGEKFHHLLIICFLTAEKLE